MFKKLENKLKNWSIKRKALNSIGGRLKMEGELSAKLIKADGTIKEYGVISRRLVTTAFCEFIVDQLITETSVFGDFQFHGSGTGTTASVIGDTALETEVETRATGTQVEDTSVIYKSIGTQTYTGTRNITEHGILNVITGGILMDRHVFTAIPVENADNIEWTYKLTVTAGG